MHIRADDALIVVDVQVDFCPGGRLPVPDGDAVVPVINDLLETFSCRVLTQDWHSPGHLSFASNHPDAEPWSTITLPYGPQILWPDHCVVGSAGASFHPELRIDGADAVIRKGFRPEIDSYSGFLENDRRTPTGLAGYLSGRGIRRVFVAGLAFDFCVGSTAVDAAAAGFETLVVEDGSRSIDLSGSDKAMRERLSEAGVRLIESANILA